MSVTSLHQLFFGSHYLLLVAEPLIMNALMLDHGQVIGAYVMVLRVVVLACAGALIEGYPGSCVALLGQRLSSSPCMASWVVQLWVLPLTCRGERWMPYQGMAKFQFHVSIFPSYLPIFNLL